MLFCDMPLTLMLALRLFRLDDDDDDDEEPSNCSSVIFYLLCCITVPFDIVLAPFLFAYAGILLCGGCDRETDNVYIMCIRGSPKKKTMEDTDSLAD
jgi:hypothetical protein